MAGAGGTPVVGGTAERTQAMKSGQGFGDVILHPSLHSRIRQLASATASTKLHAAPYRNMPVCGASRNWQETKAAKVLARESERQRVMNEEQRKLVQQQAQTKAQVARYEDELTRKRKQTISLSSGR